MWDDLTQEGPLILPPPIKPMGVKDLEEEIHNFLRLRK
jgi:hypothetical protein